MPVADAGTTNESMGVTGTITRRVDVSHRDVARRAYEIFCARGCQHGRDLDDWLQAERELRHAVKVAVA